MNHKSVLLVIVVLVRAIGTAAAVEAPAAEPGQARDGQHLPDIRRPSHGAGGGHA